MSGFLYLELESSFMYVLLIYAKKLLGKAKISTKDFYLKLSLPPHPDLLIERYENLTLVGNDEISFVFDNGFPLGFTYKGKDTVCSYYENCVRKVNPITIKQFWILQKDFTRTIREQGFENASVVQNGIGVVSEIRFIGKNESNPMKDLSEYSKPESEE